MGCLTAEQLKAAPSCVDRERVPMPEWGEGAFIYVRGLCIGEWESVNKLYTTVNGKGEDIPNGKRGLNQHMIAISAINEEYEPLYGKWNEDTRKAVNQMPVAAMMRLVDAMKRLNNFDDDEGDTAKN